jgi:hypothetical protein
LDHLHKNVEQMDLLGIRPPVEAASLAPLEEGDDQGAGRQGLGDAG